MANNALIGAVRAEATLESGKFVSGAKKIRQEAKATETQLKKSFGAMGAAAKGFGGALVAGLSIGILGGLAKRALDYAGSLGEIAQQLGVTTKQLQVYRYAASQVNISQEQMDKGLEKLNISLGAAKLGAKGPTEAFGQLSKIIGKDIVASSKQGGDALPLVADGLAKITDRAVRAKVETILFGKAGSQLDTLLSGGSKAINELSRAAEKLGIVLSDEQIQKADETADKLEAVKTVLAAQIASTVTANASSIVTLAQSLATLTGAIVNFMGSNPQAALAIIGGLAGSRFGLPGAAAGAFGGYIAGENVAAGSRDSNTDLRFRRDELSAARERFYKARRLAAKNPVTGEPVRDAQVVSTERELRKQTELTNRAVAASRRSAGVAGTAPLPQFLGGGGGGKGRTPKAPRDRSDDVTFQFDQELRRAKMDTLRAQQGMARTAEDRAAIAIQLLDAEKAMQEAELQDRVRRAERDFAEGKITAGALEQAKAQADKLRAEYASQDALERKAIADDLLAQQAEDAARLADLADDLQLEKLQLEASLAETAAERRDAELRILAAMKEQERARLQAVLADKDSSELAKAEAQLRLDNLDAIYAGRSDQAIQGTRGPMEDWMAQLPNTAAKMQEAFEQLQVQGFEGLIDAALVLTDGFDSAKDVLLNTLKQFFLGLARAQLQSAFSSFLPVGGFKLPGFASGGSFMVRGVPGVDRNLMSIGGVPVALVSYGERVSISNDNDRSNGPPGRGDIHIHGVRDFDSFHRNETQLRRQARRTLGI